jgi:AhpD family alkylhydroperoxidase
MKNKVVLPESISSRFEFKRKFSLGEMYRSFMYASRAVSTLKNNNKTNLMDKHFVERLQLTVTEANGCAACSYQHTQIALRQGMSNEDLSF